MDTELDLQNRDELKLAERAAAWLSVLRQGGAAERAAFAAWLRESPRHVEEALFATAVEKAFQNFDRERRIDVDAILAEHSSNIVTLHATAALSPTIPTARLQPNIHKRLRRWPSAALGGLAATVAILAWWQPAALGGWRSYATTVGEQRAIELTDGSLVHLNTGSRVAVRFNANARELRLLRGEALFKVQHDPTRPFRVHADDTVVQAIGTQFNVYRQAKGTTVSVLEGLVAVSNADKDLARLAAGEEARVIPGGFINKRQKQDVSQLAAWRQRRLVFQADTLQDIATEFNRYNRSLQIQIADAAAGQLRFTGVFDADDPLSLVQLLGKDRELAFERKDGVLLIRTR